MNHVVVRYVLAIAACLAIFFFYVVVSAIVGWKHGGGTIPMVVIGLAIFWVWKAITKPKGLDSSTELLTKSEDTKATTISEAAKAKIPEKNATQVILS